MKKCYFALLFTISSLPLFAQTTVTSIADGNFNDLSTWDCGCVPGPTAQVVIDHQVELTTILYMETSGTLTIGANGSLSQNGAANYIMFSLSATLHNMGTVDVSQLYITNAAEAHNHGNMYIDSLLYVSSFSTFMNHHVITGLDSISNAGSFTNEGWLGARTFYNAGDYSNTGNTQTTDVFRNEGTVLHNAGGMYLHFLTNLNDFTVDGTGFIYVDETLYNSGTFTLAAGRDIHIGTGLFNLNPDSVAMFMNNGLVEIEGDLYNGSTMDGSGSFCLSGTSTNDALITGTLDICDNSGSGIVDFNYGLIQNNVTDCNSGCTVGIASVEQEEVFTAYPNPAHRTLYLSAKGEYAIFNMAGVQQKTGISNGEVDVSQLAPGVYFIRLQRLDTVKTAKFVKQ